MQAVRVLAGRGCLTGTMEQESTKNCEFDAAKRPSCTCHALIGDKRTPRRTPGGRVDRSHLRFQLWTRRPR